MSLGPVLIWPDPTITVNVVIQQMLVLTRVLTSEKNIEIGNIQILTICDIPVLYGKGIIIPISST